MRSGENISFPKYHGFPESQFQIMAGFPRDLSVCVEGPRYPVREPSSELWCFMLSGFFCQYPVRFTCQIYQMRFACLIMGRGRVQISIQANSSSGSLSPYEFPPVATLSFHF